MNDTGSRQTVIDRMHQERQAEARRAHLLRAAREEDDAYKVKRSGVVVAPRHSLGSILESVRRGLAGAGSHGPQGAGAQ